MLEGFCPRGILSGGCMGVSGGFCLDTFTFSKKCLPRERKSGPNVTINTRINHETLTEASFVDVQIVVPCNCLRCGCKLWSLLRGAFCFNSGGFGEAFLN